MTLALAMVLATATAAPAATPAVGSASTELSILSLRSGADEIEVGISSGSANTEGDLLAASMNLVAAQVGEALEQGVLSVNADSSSEDKYRDSETEATALPLDVAGLVSGTVTLAPASAEVDPAAYSALAALGAVTIDLDLVDGLVAVRGARLGVADESLTSRASAIEGAEIGSLDVLPLGMVFDLAELSVEDIADLLIDFASTYGGAAVGEELDEVNDARSEAIDDVNDLLATYDTLDVLPDLSDDASAQDLIDGAEDCETTFAALAEAVRDLLCGGWDLAIAPLIDALNDLLDALAVLSLLGADDVEAGVAAAAFDDHGDASSLAEAGAVRVLGLGFPVSADALAATLETAATTLSDAVEDLSDLTGLHIQMSVVPLSESAVTGKDGEFYFGDASLSTLRVTALVAEDQVSEPLLDADLRVLSLGATARHRPGVATPGAPDNPDLANTGVSPLMVAAAVLLVILGVRLRRWLGDAA